MNNRSGAKSKKAALLAVQAKATYCCQVLLKFHGWVGGVFLATLFALLEWVGRRETKDFWFSHTSSSSSSCCRSSSSDNYYVAGAEKKKKNLSLVDIFCDMWFVFNMGKYWELIVFQSQRLLAPSGWNTGHTAQKWEIRDTVWNRFYNDANLIVVPISKCQLLKIVCFPRSISSPKEGWESNSSTQFLSLREFSLPAGGDKIRRMCFFFFFYLGTSHGFFLLPVQKRNLGGKLLYPFSGSTISLTIFAIIYLANTSKEQEKNMFKNLIFQRLFKSYAWADGVHSSKHAVIVNTYDIP